MMDRRSFLGFLTGAAALSLVGCSSARENNSSNSSSSDNSDNEKASSEAALPQASPNPDSNFLIDQNITVENIDDYLGRSDAVYRDMRMIHDPADYAAVGGSSELSVTVEGFKIVPFPYIGTLQKLPVSGAYNGEHLFNIEWNDDGTVRNATPRFEQSEEIISDLFPSDKAIFLMCGGAGYAYMMRQFLVYLGYDQTRLYNIGGAWDYVGYHPVEVTQVDENGKVHYFLWKVDIANLDFSYLDAIQSQS